MKNKNKETKTRMALNVKKKIEKTATENFKKFRLNFLKMPSVTKLNNYNTFLSYSRWYSEAVRFLDRVVHIGGGGGGGGRGAKGGCRPARKTKCFFLLFWFCGLFLGAILVRNLYTGYPCEGVRSLPPRYGPAGSSDSSSSPSTGNQSVL